MGVIDSVGNAGGCLLCSKALMVLNLLWGVCRFLFLLQVARGKYDGHTGDILRDGLSTTNVS